MSNQLRDEIRDRIRTWNQQFPIDYWWRKKYKIPFNSEAHRRATLLEMFYDYEEERIMEDIIRKIKDEDRDDEPEFEPDSIVGKKMSKKELDEAFDELDVSQFNKKQ